MSPIARINYGKIAPLAGLRPGRQEKSTFAWLDVHHRLVSVYLQIELLHYAPQVCQVLLAGSALLGCVGKRDAGNLDALGGTEEIRLRRPPGHGVAYLAGFKCR
jgi:hypothetical protein